MTVRVLDDREIPLLLSFVPVKKIKIVGPKNVSHKEVLSWANFRSRLPEHVRSLEEVAQRSIVALAKVREIADRRCARSRDAPIRLPTKSASTKRLFVCNMLQI
jgi:hypothetical protein